ncbi:MAG: hypothetical protein JNJ57_01305, partial [Saprospiraceae bacterium]|nr:hypothetical protein [Saprospiraceae bacterium]
MKKLMILAVFSIALTSVTTAQIDPDRRDERLANYRAEVFSRVLRFSSEEAQGFWPIYNEFLDRREQLQQDMKAQKQEDQMSDAEVEEQIKRYFDKKQRELDLEKDLYQKLRKVLPSRKIAKLPFAEREFRESLVKKLQENRQKRMQERPMRPG